MSLSSSPNTQRCQVSAHLSHTVCSLCLGLSHVGSTLCCAAIGWLALADWLCDFGHHMLTQHCLGDGDQRRLLGARACTVAQICYPGSLDLPNSLVAKWTQHGPWPYLCLAISCGVWTLPQRMLRFS